LRVGGTIGVMTDKIPLIVDLDGTLSPADHSLESFVRFARAGLHNIWLLLCWLLRGKQVAKALVARRLGPVPIPPFRPEVSALIATAIAAGRPVMLASGSHWRAVKQIAAAHGGFDGYLGSTMRINLTGARKLARLRTQLGEQAFDYIGDSRADRPLWRAARQAYTTGISAPGVTRLGTRPPWWRVLVKSLRPQQWSKNALVLVPLATAGLLFDPNAVARALLALLCFSFAASAIYQVNDLLDIEADRAHPKKRARPLAAGTLSIPAALLLTLVLVMLALGGGVWLLGTSFALTLLAYISISLAYSWRLKAVMTLDVIALACLYTLRIIAGAVAIQVLVSSWLLVFSLFFFLSLGYLKRYTELAQAVNSHELVKGRGYVGGDLELVALSGVAAGMVSILVLALFINDSKATGVYATPPLLWGLCLILLYWINRIWLMARRGEVEGDPVAHALNDRRSIVLGAAMGLILLVARFVHIPL
jgi:4-hydroxybenzoate polyprenyltransferase